MRSRIPGWELSEVIEIVNKLNDKAGNFTCRLYGRSYTLQAWKAFVVKKLWTSCRAAKRHPILPSCQIFSLKSDIPWRTSNWGNFATPRKQNTEGLVYMSRSIFWTSIPDKKVHANLTRDHQTVQNNEVYRAGITCRDKWLLEQGSARGHFTKEWYSGRSRRQSFCVDYR